MDAPPGRREAHKQATRQALRDAAERLFAERGYEETTVRDIAAAAGVTERTFYRYFGDKPALVAEELLAWLDRVGEEIVARPATESDLEAVEAAVLKLAQRRAREAPSLSGWLARDPAPAMAGIRSTMPRPLLRVEASIAAALGRRAEANERRPDPFRDAVVARIAVAIFRNAMIQVRGEPEAPRGRFPALVKRGFAVARDL